MFAKISASILQILWSRPQESTPGRIQQYLVSVETRAESVFQDSVPGQQNTVLISNLSKTRSTPAWTTNHYSTFCIDKYIPYNVSVRARNSAGYGLATRNVTFTEEGSKLMTNSNK